MGRQSNVSKPLRKRDVNSILYTKYKYINTIRFFGGILADFYNLLPEVASI